MPEMSGPDEDLQGTAKLGWLLLERPTKQTRHKVEAFKVLTPTIGGDQVVRAVMTARVSATDDHARGAA